MITIALLLVHNITNKSSLSHQYESRDEGGSACQSHVKFGRQGVEKHAYCREDKKEQISQYTVQRM